MVAFAEPLGVIGSAGIELGINDKDKIAMMKVVDLIYGNLSNDWDSFVTQLQQMSDLLRKELTVESLEKVLIVEEVKRKSKEYLSE